ncbi:MAG TPA: MBL fold metallo-hydrolase [Alphaproteobacteria bacterium]|nr:MBL fold metallo-hydrolase [Alphaproteobacteria bacterium]
MNRRVFSRLNFVYAAAVAALASLAAPAMAQDKMELRTVTDGVYMMQNDRGSSNATFVVTPEGVVVLDADLRTADQVLTQIRKMTDKKVKYLITSHSAGDHASGAWQYREDKPVFIATKTQMRDLYMQEGKEFEERKKTDEVYKKSELVRPDIGFEGGMTLQFGGLTFVLTEEGVGHSTSDVTVYIPQKRVMLMGDLLDTEIHPGQGESAGVFYSNVKGWLKSLDSIMARNLPVDTYVPGHGPVHIGRGVADLQEQKSYFITMRDEVSKMMKAGKTLAQIEKEIELPKEFAHYQRKPRLVSFVKLFYYQNIEQGY